MICKREGFEEITEVDVTRGDGWLQKVLYLVMVILGVYILYKGGGLLMQSNAVQNALDGGAVQRILEDAAVRTWAPGYAASVEKKDGIGWMAGWMSQVVPVYSYLAEHAEPESSSVQETADRKHAGAAGGTGRREDTAESEQTESSGHVRGHAEESGEKQSRVSEPAEKDGKPKSRVPESAEETGRDGSDLPQETAVSEADPGGVREVLGRNISEELREQLSDYNYLLNQYFTVDGGTAADAELLDAEKLLAADLSIEQKPEVPQILIYHTHSQEEFADSVPGDVSTTIVGMGDTLAELLTGYGYQVIHDTQVYDLVDGVLDRSAAYDHARVAVEQILAEHPTIEVVIDLHRDGVDGQKFVTEIDGKPTSMIMFFNGISRNSKDEPLTYLQNPYISENLAFSLQLELKARDQYPGYTRNIYLKAERFNLHLRPRSLLIEAGTQLNTVEEERNAMVPLADLLHQVLSGR